MKSNLNLLFHNQDFKNSLRSSNTRNSKSFMNETTDTTKLKQGSKISKSVSKLDTIQSPKNQIKRTPASVRENLKFTEKPDIKKPSFSQIYKNYVKPNAEKTLLNNSLFSPQLLSVKESGISQSDRSGLGITNRVDKREVRKQDKSELSQSLYSFTKFLESRDQYLSLVNSKLVQFEFDEVDLFEFLICLRENVPV